MGNDIVADDELRELGQALLSHIDALMPAIERAIAAEWKRGNYINGPQFGATIEAFRAALASADTHPKGSDMDKLDYERIPTRVSAKQWFKDGDDERVVFAKSLGGQSWLSNQWCVDTPRGYQVVEPGFWLVMDPDLLVMCDLEFRSKYRPARTASSTREA